jgi:hypothetical protein
VVAELRSQVSRLEAPGTVLVEPGPPFFDYYTWAIMAELDRRGIDFVVGDETTVSQVGPRRRDDGSASARLFVIVGPDADVTPSGARQVAYVDGGPDRLRVGVYLVEATGSP